MTFKASKLRVKKATPFGEGKPIIPNAGVSRWYADQLQPKVAAMTAEYEKIIMDVLETPQSDQFFESSAMDASIFDLIKKRNKRLDKIFDDVFSALNKKWSKIFEKLSEDIAPEFVRRAAEAANGSALFSLSAAGITEPRKEYDTQLKNSLGSYTDYNKTLITSIHAEAHDKIYNSVMTSMTSPIPEEQGMAGIKKTLGEIGINEKNRVSLICRDQTSKLYGALGADRMKNNGVRFFRWQHTFGPGESKKKGKIAWRESHMHLNNEVFWIDDPDLWKPNGKYFTKKGDIGIPGYAINCHCRMIPIVMLTAADIVSLENKYDKKLLVELGVYAEAA